MRTQTPQFAVAYMCTAVRSSGLIILPILQENVVVICKYRARVAALEEELHKLEASLRPASHSSGISEFQMMHTPHLGAPFSPFSQYEAVPASGPSKTANCAEIMSLDLCVSQTL